MVRHGAPALQSNGSAAGPRPSTDYARQSPPTAHSWAELQWNLKLPGPWIKPLLRARGKGAPAGLGTVKPDVGGHVNPAFPMNDRYLALEAYKFAVPNTESTLPGSTCPTCTPTAVGAANTRSLRDLAELVEGLGGAIVATHSQGGAIGMHMVRYLKADGKLDMLKGLLNIELVSCGRGPSSGTSRGQTSKTSRS